MISTKNYALEYWIDLNHFSKEQLENHVKGALEKFLKKINLEIKEEKRYLILCITATDKVIDSCHDKLNFDREWSFRAKDELGEALRSRAYPILSEIELWLRNFIQKAMINVLGFDWWNSISEDIRARVKDIETRAGKHQVQYHHPIEFTFFEDLIAIVTAKFQAWPSGQPITVSDLCELLSTCDSIEKIRREIENRSRVVSFWDDVFSDYFDDKNSWTQFKDDIEKTVIPIRNKVAHHRLIRCYELEKLEKSRDELQRVLGSAKDALSDSELEEVQPDVKIIIDNLRQRFKLEPELLKRLTQPMLSYEQLMQTVITPEHVERLRQSTVSPEYVKRLMQTVITPEHVERLRQPIINPEQVERLIERLIKSTVSPEQVERLMQPMVSPEEMESLRQQTEKFTSQAEKFVQAEEFIIQENHDSNDSDVETESEAPTSDLTSCSNG